MDAKKKRTAGERRKQLKEKEENAKLLLVFGDFLVTGIWVCLSSTFGEAAEALASISGLGEFALTVTVIVSAIMMMGPMCDMFGGAMFNPIHNAAFVCAGRGTLTLNVVRMVAQIGGALGGSYLAVTITPEWLKDRFHTLPGGLKPGVALGVGVGVEMLLGMVLNMVVLYASDAQRSKFVAYWSPVFATVLLIVTGSYFTGPSMNPAVAFSWYHHYQGHSWLEQIAVYWLAPFAGAMLGGLLYRLLLKPAEAAAVKPARRLPPGLKAAAAGAKEE
ncbi:hypothetical protein OEZ85_013988 [Tetradesmus obliquus]|uniref:Aquaporin n=1 Tax=Tetradesmus obliquus TaxID=3088 RepID=A0ABY8U7K1_TETOB|nr:hypothetical protein OEZ85_013988 [Tetradesmus obliquus]